MEQFLYNGTDEGPAWRHHAPVPFISLKGDDPSNYDLGNVIYTGENIQLTAGITEESNGNKSLTYGITLACIADAPAATSSPA